MRFAEMETLETTRLILRKQTMEDLYRERTCLYEKWADLTVDECGLTLEKTAERIREAVGKAL